jgi:hypothetical protein
MAEPISFYVHEDFQFKIGKAGKEIAVPRMKFITGGKVISRIAEIQGKDMRGAIGLLLQVQKGQDVTAVDNIESVVSSLIREKNYDMLVEVLSMISEGSITLKVIEENKCQFGEVVQMLGLLIEGNFSSLKNLSASLKAITSSGQ